MVGLLKCDRLIRGAETVEGGTWTDEEGGGWQGNVWEDDFVLSLLAMSPLCFLSDVHSAHYVKVRPLCLRAGEALAHWS